MKELVRHLVENNFDEILSMSLLNCHVRGVHSIMLSSSPEKTIRLYVAEERNELINNFPLLMDEGLTVAFHPHHCNLTLHCIKGALYNWIVEEKEWDGMPLQKYLYHSKIKEGEINFELVGKDYLETSEKSEWLFKGDSVSMKANEIHTVGCMDGTPTAWLVYEGKEDLNYKSYCWSNADLNNLDSSELYLKPSAQQIMDLLIQFDLL